MARASMASSGREPHYIVLMGDVGSGKSTLVEKVSGVSGMSSQSSTSATRQSGLYFSTDSRVLVCDTPGTNPLTEKFESNAWIATAINYLPVSRLVIVVEANVRIGNVQLFYAMFILYTRWRWRFKLRFDSGYLEK